MRLSSLSLAALLAATALCAPVLAQTPSPAAPSGQAKSTAPASQPAAGADPVVGRVGSQEIHLSDVRTAMQSVPEQMRNMPEQVLFPMVLDQMVDQGALAAEARKQGLDKDPTVARSMQMAADRALQNALLRKEITPQISDAAVKAKYQQDYANKPGEEEVHARHILVASEDEAKKIIAQLQKGDDFAALAKAHSTDTGSQQNGGDLGWFKKGDMVPAFAEAAFSLKSGQVSPTPIHTQFGWHVIQVLETRNAPPPTLEEAQDQIRQQLISDGIQKAVAQAKADVKIETFNADGSPRRATDTAVPPSAPKP